MAVRLVQAASSAPAQAVPDLDHICLSIRWFDRILEKLALFLRREDLWLHRLQDRAMDYEDRGHGDKYSVIPKHQSRVSHWKDPSRLCGR